MNTPIVQFLFGILRYATGIFFCVVAVRKLFHVEQLQQSIERFAVFPVDWAYPIACLGIATEIVVGLGLCIRKTFAGAAMIGSALTCCFVLLFVQGWIRGLSLSCNCLGTERELSSYPFEIAWRLGLFTLMLILLFYACKNDRSQRKTPGLDFSDI